jgi:hypothetical protein
MMVFMITSLLVDIREFESSSDSEGKATLVDIIK